MEKGLIHIYCGDGKGKTTCATGLAVRCCGSGGKVLWFQFLKNDSSGERRILEQIEKITLLPGYPDIKFTNKMTVKEQESARIFYQNRLKEIRERVRKESFDLLVLDEAMGAIQSGMIEEKQMIEFLLEKPEGLEVVLTGRNPGRALMELADYVSDIHKVKHPFERGIRARKMIEW